MNSAKVTVSSRGYVVLPARLRKEMDIKAGTKVLLTKDDDRIILQPVLSFTDRLSGLTAKTFGKTAEDVSEYIDKEREDR
ncbi:MAG: AbrB/MazE/SpoVT family DNA-binding domain-containing protein [Deltaproteobacteria bacterium]|nr:AbrB/MazE/SpoVT family DNA-binding domain-containing protein [Deltaproteobacteria bacterium]